MSLSKNGVAIVILVLGWLGVDVTDNMVLEFVGAVAQVIAFILMVWNQLDRKDTVGFLFKK
jgi:hypothetical protein